MKKINNSIGNTSDVPRLNRAMRRSKNRKNRSVDLGTLSMIGGDIRHEIVFFGEQCNIRRHGSFK